jgi:hypothetical protein
MRIDLTNKPIHFGRQETAGGNPPPNNEGTPPPNPGVTQEQFQQVTSQLARLTEQNQEYARLLLDPSYLEFIASKQGGDSQGGRPRGDTSGAQPKQGAEPDWDNMSMKDFAQYMMMALKGEINAAVTPIRDTTEMDRANRDIQATAAKHEDFWLYQKEMFELAKRNPNLTAQQCYNLAKAEVGPRQPKPKPTPGATPNNPQGGNVVEPKTKGTAAALERAWQQVVGNKDSLA